MCLIRRVAESEIVASTFGRNYAIMPTEDDKVASLSMETIAGKRTYPAAVTLTGTISSAGVAVTGVGTSFLTELVYEDNPIILRYKYIYDGAQNELREIAKVLNATTLLLKTAFSSNLSGIALKSPDYRTPLIELSVICAGAGGIASTIGGTPVTMIANTLFTFKNQGGIAPMAVDGSVSALQVTTMF